MKHTLKILSLLLIFTLAFSFAAFASEKPTVANRPQAPTSSGSGFSDVNSGAGYAPAVAAMSSAGIITGYPDGTFKPYNTLTRAEAAVIICRLNGNFNLGSSYTVFTDVTSSYSWASGYIAKANNLGIINGVGNNRYNPGGTLTGEQWIKMAVCWLGLESDAQRSGGWPDGYVTVARNNGLLNSVSITNYKSTISRADACVIANNALAVK